MMIESFMWRRRRNRQDMIRDDPDAIAYPDFRRPGGRLRCLPVFAGNRARVHLRQGAASLGLGRPRSLPRPRPAARAWRTVSNDRRAVGLLVLSGPILPAVRRSAVD